MSDDRLVAMANQIGTFFSTQRKEDVAPAIADHIAKFWNPKMREALLLHWRAGGTGLQNDVCLALAHLAAIRAKTAELTAPD